MASFDWKVILQYYFEQESDPSGGVSGFMGQLLWSLDMVLLISEY